MAMSTGYHVTHRLFEGGRRIRVDDLKIASTDLKIVLFTFLIVGEITIFRSQYIGAHSSSRVRMQERLLSFCSGKRFQY